MGLVVIGFGLAVFLGVPAQRWQGVPEGLAHIVIATGALAALAGGGFVVPGFPEA